MRIVGGERFKSKTFIQTSGEDIFPLSTEFVATEFRPGEVFTVERTPERNSDTDESRALALTGGK